MVQVKGGAASNARALESFRIRRNTGWASAFTFKRDVSLIGEQTLGRLRPRLPRRSGRTVPGWPRPNPDGHFILAQVQAFAVFTPGLQGWGTQTQGKSAAHALGRVGQRI